MKVSLRRSLTWKGIGYRCVVDLLCGVYDSDHCFSTGEPRNHPIATVSSIEQNSTLEVTVAILPKYKSFRCAINHCQIRYVLFTVLRKNDDSY